MRKVDIMHVGLTVKDIDRAKAFYEALGFSEVTHHILDEEYISAREQLYNLPKGTVSKISMLAGTNGIQVELFEFNHTEDAESLVWNRQGITHFDITTDDVDGIYERVQELGAEIAYPICNGMIQRYFFCRDLDGNLIEVGQPFST